MTCSGSHSEYMCYGFPPVWDLSVHAITIYNGEHYITEPHFSQHNSSTYLNFDIKVIKWSVNESGNVPTDTTLSGAMFI